MDNVYVLRERLQTIYGRHSKIFDKGLQFLLALVAFLLINQNVGFMKAASSPVITVALAVICTFLPLMATVVMATALLLAHMFSLSLGVFAVTAVVFLVMYCFFFRLAPKMAFLVLLTPIAFALKIPYLLPIVWAGVCAVKLGGNFLRNDRILYDGICKKDLCCIRRWWSKRTNDADYQICKAGVPE